DDLFLSLFAVLSVLPSTVTMPRGQKSKLRAREKRRQTRTQNAPEEEAAPGPLCECPHQDIPAEGMPTPNMLQEAHSTFFHTYANTGAGNNDEKSSDDFDDLEAWSKDPINQKVVLLVQFLMEKYHKKEVITKADMLKCVIKTSKNHFSEILKRASEHMELAFGVDLKEVDPIRHCYALFNKLEHNFDGMKGEEKMPNTGLLMMVLGVIFRKNNCASEKEVWEVLNMMGVYPNKKHFIYGEPKKVITEDLVRMRYLEYRKIPDSNPPSFEFTWGPRAQAEISKMKILEFWAKIHDTTPTAFATLYEIAVKDEEERAQARSAARARTAAKAGSMPLDVTTGSICLENNFPLSLIVLIKELLQDVVFHSDGSGISFFNIFFDWLLEVSVGKKFLLCQVSCLSIFVLLFLSQVIMPRGQKSKGRSRAKRQNEREKSQSLQDSEPTAKEETTSSVGQGDPPRSPDTCIPQDNQVDVASVSDDSSVFLTGAVGVEASDANAESSIISAERCSSTSTIPSTICSIRKDPINRNAGLLMEFILGKFKEKEPFTQKDMLKVIKRKDKEKFAEIIKRTSVRLELVFGLELKEVDPSSQSYRLVGKLGLSTEGKLSSNSGLPKTGLLMTLLAVIFMNGNSASEEDVWEFLKVVGMYPGQNHPIFGEPRKFITKDLVKEKYLLYRQLGGTDPPTNIFMWGPRAYAETTKMKVLEVVAKINDDVPSSFPSLYEQALADEANRAARRFTAVPGNFPDSGAPFSYKRHTSSHI
ncbi:melanoma-associated antigen B18, partial [Sigmodon hispidus]